MSSTGDVWIKVRFRRFRLISIDTHLWSECDKQMVDIQRKKHDAERRHQSVYRLLAAFSWGQAILMV